jgi:bis(5'-nucleosyl)-tetraphosphatase (symmetrical)
VTRYAIGDIQGCASELRALLARLRFSVDRDRLWLVGDLVNRGPQSLEVLRLVRDLGDAAITVLGNHDLHLIACALGARTRPSSGDTLDEVLEAPDRDRLIEWLLRRPLAHLDAERRDLLVHAGLVPQWSATQAVALAREVESVLERDPRRLLGQMYGDQPVRWSETLAGPERWRFIVNVLTRLRVCTADGRVDLKAKGPPTRRASGAHYRPWFELPRASDEVRVIFGHWSALGYVNAHRVLGLDSGCVWGGSLTAVDLDAPAAPPVQLPCSGYQLPG